MRKAFGHIMTTSSVLSEPSLNVVVMHDFFLEGVRARFRRLHHLDNFGVVLTTTSLQGCNYFLCHGDSVLFDFFVYGHFLQNWIVLLRFQSFWSVFTVLRGDITACSWKT